MGQVFDQVITDQLAASSGKIGAGVDAQIIHISSAALPAGTSALYGTYPTQPAGGGTVIGIGALCFMPWVAGLNGLVNQIAFNVTVVGAAGSVARIGMYDADGSNLPNDLQADSGPIATDGAIGLKTAAVNVPVRAGKLYYMAYICGVAAPTITVFSSPSPYFGHASPGLTAQCGLFIPLAFGPLPSSSPWGGPGSQFISNSQGIAVWARYA